MAWTLRHTPLLGIIEISFSGLITSTDLARATSDCISLGNRTSTSKILIDSTRIELAVSLADLLNLTDQYVDQKANRLSRISLILPMSEPARGLAHFFETACVNRGWFVKGFTGRQPALDWLLGIPDSGRERSGQRLPSHLSRSAALQQA